MSHSLIHSKRTKSDDRSYSPDNNASNKRQETLSSAEAEAAAKVGRKPLLSEPKDKRTAQNRALQRLYRERKEKRLKELEEKVTSLEDEKLELHNESEFLRIQVETLMGELKKFRNDVDLSSLLPQKVASLSSKASNSDFSTSKSSSATPSSSIDSPLTRELNNKAKKQQGFAFDYSSVNLKNDSSSDNSTPYHANIAISDESSGSVTAAESAASNTPKNPGLTSLNNDSISSSSSSVCTSNSPNYLQDLGVSNPDEKMFSNFGYSLRRSSILSNDVTNNLNDTFDEKLNEFCLKLSEACGSKSCPIPKSLASKGKATNSTVVSGNTLTTGSPFQDGPAFSDSPLSPFNALINEHLRSPDVQQQQQQQQQQVQPLPVNDPYSFLNETPFDPSIAFGFNEYDDFLSENQPIPETENSDISKLVTEESLYDPLGMFVSGQEGQPDTAALATAPPNEMSIFSPLPQSQPQDQFNLASGLQKPSTNANVGDADGDENAMVPSNDGNLLKCSLIWDRITQHPRYTEIDIEGLCAELKQKLKCCEKGAVVEAKYVNKLLDSTFLDKIDNAGWFKYKN